MHILSSDVKELCTVQCEINFNDFWWEKIYRNPKSKEKWKNPTLDLEVALNAATVKFGVSYKGTPVACTEVKYKEDT
jgi:hypothetical protein